VASESLTKNKESSAPLSEIPAALEPDPELDGVLRTLGGALPDDAVEGSPYWARFRERVDDRINAQVMAQAVGASGPSVPLDRVAGVVDGVLIPKKQVSPYKVVGYSVGAMAAVLIVAIGYLLYERYQPFEVPVSTGPDMGARGVASLEPAPGGPPPVAPEPAVVAPPESTAAESAPADAAAGAVVAVSPGGGAADAGFAAADDTAVAAAKLRHKLKTGGFKKDKKAGDEAKVAVTDTPPDVAVAGPDKAAPPEVKPGEKGPEAGKKIDPKTGKVVDVLDDYLSGKKPPEETDGAEKPAAPAEPTGPVKKHLKQHEVRSVIVRAMGRIGKCSVIETGKFTASFKVKNDGTVADLTVKPASAASACIGNILSKLSFPAHDDAPVPVVYPFELKPE